MTTPARSLPPDAVVAVSAASRAVGELAGVLSGLPDSAVWTGWLRRVARDGDELDVAVRCALGDSSLLDAVALRPSTTLVDRLGAVAEAARWAAGAVRSADGLHRRHLAIAERERLGRHAAAALALLAEQGEVTIRFVVERLGMSPTTAGLLAERLAALGIAEEVTGRRRNRVFRYTPLLRCFERERSAADMGTGKNGGMDSDSATRAEWARIAAQRLFERTDAQRVIVFGSVGRGDDGPDSDIDLLVVLPVHGRKHDVAVRLLAELRDIPAPIDVVVVDVDEYPTEARLPGIVRVAVREGRAFERAA